MADTNNTSIRFIEESTAGTVPSNPQFQQFCHTGAGFAANPVLQQSQRICGSTSSRAPEAPTLIGNAPNGTLPVEFSHELWFFMKGLFQNTPNFQNYRSNRAGATQITDISTNVITVSSGTAFTTADLVYLYGMDDSSEDGVYGVTGTPGATTVEVDGTITDDASPGGNHEIRVVGFEGSSGDLSTSTSGTNRLISSSDFDFTADYNIEAGDWVKLGGSATSDQFATAGCNGWCRVSNVAATTLTFDRVPSGFATDAGTSKTIRVFVGDGVSDGRTKTTYAAEVNYLADDGTNLYRVFPGVFPDSLSIAGSNTDTSQFVTGSMGFSGITNPTQSSTRTSGATTLLPVPNNPYSTGAKVARIAEGGTPITDADYAVLNYSLDINNNNQRLGGWGYDAGVGVRSGDFTIGGNLETYFNDLTLLDKVLNNTQTSIDTILTDPEYNFAWVIDLPVVEVTGDPSAAGRGGVHTLPLNYTAHPSSTLGYAAKVQWFWAYTDD